MSKAFAPGESDNDEEREISKAPLLPPGTPNYITPAGAAKLEADCERLIAEKAALGGGVEVLTRGKALARRIEFLTERLNAIKVIDPLQQPTGRVLFGASVSVQYPAGEKHTWRIVGIDETDLSKGWISWISPLAKALLDKRVGDTATLGAQKLIVLAISYESVSRE